ncbi:hypothetical protein BDZ89DRAFT_174486 [Hymenopellis radicata]|nr:hypothetical protein BDZ89DRAFT_174486 [Hymenopellis radicata]
MARTWATQMIHSGSKALLQLLRIMLGVEGFQLKDENVTSEFLDGLVVGAEKGAVVLPSLKTLNLRDCGFVDHDEALDSILRIVESRSLTRLCPALERIVLPQEDWLTGFVVDGVEVIRLYRNHVVED